MMRIKHKQENMFNNCPSIHLVIGTIFYVFTILRINLRLIFFFNEKEILFNKYEFKTYNGRRILNA